MRGFLDAHGDAMEFCQIQLNYLDWTLQDGKGKFELLTERNIPLWAMEPVRGGRLAALSEGEEARLKALRPDESVASWGFRWLRALPNVTMILSGMSNMEQMVDNVKTFSVAKPLGEDETALLYEIADGMKNSVPCTACRYCCDDCPQGLDIPRLLDIYNQLRFSPGINIAMRVDAIPEDKRYAACASCGACSKMCPQNIDIPAAMQHSTEILSKIPS